ncbi:MAG: hybrid sensor histidine kinase/response regulator [Proteobacteria bacterium]|nr:hybrid sensor histidine kinase/response regulator [Pseudomonadota bacterium]
MSEPDASAARADPRVADELYQIALAGDRRAVAITVLGSFFVASLLQQKNFNHLAWVWCAACEVLAGLRLLLIWHRKVDPRLWLAALLLTSVTWGAGPLLFLRMDPTSDTLLTGFFLAAAGLSTPLLCAWRPAIYASLIPSLIPLLVALAVRFLSLELPEATHPLLLAAVCTAFLVMVERLAAAQNDSLALLLAVRVRNEDLVQQLRSQIDVAARANEEKTRFVASAAHDLRQPLHALGMFCATLEQRLLNTPEKPLVRNMMNAIESLETSFGAMLDISRLDAGVVKTAPQTFPIRDVFRRLYQHFGGDAEARGLALRFRATRRLVNTDPLLLERVLGNLVQNALRYTRQGGVLVAARRNPRGVALEVWDTGLGIPPDKQQMIFREFYQIDNPERDRGRGLGMGLAIVQRICQLLELPLELQSTFGRGSVFRVIVPLGNEQGIVTSPAEADTLPPRKTGTITVLLIDDDRAIREATRELLRPLQVDVIVAASIEEAVVQAQSAAARIDMILSDWRLRGQENGVEAVRAVRAITGEATPAVLITGDTSTELLQLAHENGLVVLHKPLQPRQLVRLIKHLRR